MSQTYANVQNIDFQNYERVIAISDIHGDIQGFRGVLNKLQLTDRDALVIVGDLIDKGEHSLDVLNLVMELSKKENVFTVLGNNEAFVLEWYEGNVPDEEMFGYVASRDTGLLLEMAQRIYADTKLNFADAEQSSVNIEPNPADTELNFADTEPSSVNSENKFIFCSPADLTILRTQVSEHFSAEINFLKSLPVILDSSIATFVHAGLQPGPLDQQDYWYCLSAPAFARETHVFEKTVIVGHWPASNYGDTVIRVNPYFSPGTNVISIDGGNSMKSWAQINYLILDPATGTMESRYYDTLPKIRAIDAQKESEDPLTLVFPNTKIEVREKGETESTCFVPYLSKELTVPNDRIYEYKGQTYCYDFTTYDMAVEEGEVLTFCGETPDAILVKRDGIVGNYRGKYTSFFSVL